MNHALQKKQWAHRCAVLVATVKTLLDPESYIPTTDATGQSVDDPAAVESEQARVMLTQELFYDKVSGAVSDDDRVVLKEKKKHIGRARRAAGLRAAECVEEERETTALGKRKMDEVCG